MNLYHSDGTPTDLNFILRGVLVTAILVTIGLFAVANPAPWSALGKAEAKEKSNFSQTVEKRTGY